MTSKSDIFAAIDRAKTLSAEDAVIAAMTSNPADVQDMRGKLTPEFLVATPLKKWGLLALNGLLGTSEPWIDDMRDALRNQEAEIERLRAALQQSRSAERLLERIDRLELALEPLSIMFGAANMNEPINVWLNMAHLAAARAALSQEQTNDRT